MTREQAINYLISSGFTDDQVSEVVRALTYEPTPKNDLGVDCISRAYLLDDSKYHTVFNDDTGNFEDVVYREDIRKAPSVAPQLKIGHWIFDGDCLICNKCKKAYSFTGSNFCPNCGADMREVKDGK